MGDFGRALRALSGLGLLCAGAGCVKPDVSDLDAYQTIPMGRAVPYPSEQERSQRVFSVAVVERPAEGVAEAGLAGAREQVREGLEQFVRSYGAALIAPAAAGAQENAADGAGSEFAGVDAGAAGSTDYALSVRFTNYRHFAVFEKPSKLPWQTPEEIAKKPGTCTHTAEVAFDVALVQKGWEDVVRRTWLVTHAAEQENKDLDPACTISPATIDTLHESAIAEALACLEIPVATRISPRGHVLAHRKAKDAETHIFQVSLGTEQGVDPGEPLEIRRVELSRGADGSEIRTETPIAEGVATQQIAPQDTWVAIDLADADKEILEGDVVKRVFSKGLLGNLTGPDCKKILAER